MRPESRCARCLYYCRASTTFLFSHIGLCGLVVGYAIMGAFTFEALEAANERTKRTEMVAARRKVVEDLWATTADSSVLMERNWTENVTMMLRDFELNLVKAMRKEGYDGNDESPLQWSFSGALLYSIIVITTIGYGNIAPKTLWGKVVTILYAIVGIPLMLLCLSNIGDAMAHSFKFIYWKVCCYFCVKPNKHRRRRRRYPAAHLDDYDKTDPDGYMTPEPMTPSYPGTPHFQPVNTFPRTPAQAEANRVPIISNRYVMQTGDDMPPYPHPPPQPMPQPTPSPTTKSCSWKLDTVERDDDSEDDEMDEDDTGDGPRDVSVPIWLCLAIVMSYICGGAVLFTFWEEWDFLDSSYFCFVTLTTIGFGDLVPGTAVLSEDAQLTLGLCALYLLFGMALLAMSFNLVQEEVTKSVKCIGKRLGILADDDDDH